MKNRPIVLCFRSPSRPRFAVRESQNYFNAIIDSQFVMVRSAWEACNNDYAQMPEDRLVDDLCLQLDMLENCEGGRSYLGPPEVSKSFGSKLVLDDVSLTVMSGETVCVMGRSGVGKSVCLQTLMGFLKPDSGRVIVAHEDITDFSEQQLDQVHKKVTMLFEGGALFDSLTVGENVAYPLREHRGIN